MANCGEVWLVDLGMVGKVRPCVVLSVPADARYRPRSSNNGSSHDEQPGVAVRVPYER